jgi:hypothetical protein
MIVMDTCHIWDNMVIWLIGLPYVEEISEVKYQLVDGYCQLEQVTSFGNCELSELVHLFDHK